MRWSATTADDRLPLTTDDRALYYDECDRAPVYVQVVMITGHRQGDDDRGTKTQGRGYTRPLGPLSVSARASRIFSLQIVI